MNSAKRILAAAAAVSLLAAAGARAESASGPQTPAAAAVDQVLSEPVLDPAAAAPAAATPSDGARPMSTKEMGGISAGADTVTATALSNQQLTATTSGNSITVGTLNSGAVTFDANALAGFNGVGNFLVNTGANNTLQGGINISIVTAPGAP